MTMAAWLVLATAWGHALAPTGLEVSLADEGRTAEFAWSEPTALRLAVPDDCEGTPLGERRQRWTCAAPLSGRSLVVEGLAATERDVVATVSDAEGTRRVLLDRRDPTLPLRRSEGAAALLVGFAALGGRHLLEGADHLLIVAGLLLLLGVGGRLLRAVTAFTVGHAVTLGLAAAGFTLPSGLVEPMIAASVLWLGLDLLERDGSILARRPDALCLGIGLVHGLGFGGALADLGLRGGDLVPALLGFHAGIELAQLGVLALAAGALATLSVDGRARARVVGGWFLGAWGACWLFERLLT